MRLVRLARPASYDEEAPPKDCDKCPFGDGCEVGGCLEEQDKKNKNDK